MISLIKSNIQILPKIQMPSKKTLKIMAAVTGVVAIVTPIFVNYVMNYQHDEFVRQVGYELYCCGKITCTKAKEYPNSYHLFKAKLAWMTGWLTPNSCWLDCSGK